MTAFLMAKRACFAAILLSGLPIMARAQVDTARAAQLAAVVVTADRIATSIASATAAVTRLDSLALRRNPVRSVADALRLTPGLAFIDFDGLGRDPQIMLRGFYGGGEAEYILLLLDGRPLNSLESGRVSWDQVPLTAIESIEIVRGGASAAWGDAALGGVINIRTKQRGAEAVSATIEAGTFGEMRASANSVGSWNGRPLSAFAGLSRSAGFREHAGLSAVTMGATLGVIDEVDKKLVLATSHEWRTFSDPGPLGDDDLAVSRTQSAPFFRFDQTREHTHRAALDLDATLAPGTSFTSQLGAEYRGSDRVRTLVLSPEFGDTKNRLLGSTRIAASAQVRSASVVLGVDASLGSLRTRHFEFAQGGPDDYADNDDAVRGDLNARGVGTRTALAGYAIYSDELAQRLRFSAGARVDWLRDNFDASDPSEPSQSSATHVAFSPKVGINWRYAGSQGSSHSGNLYVNFGRSFKAPTQDQLFDQRSVPVPFPPFAITFANGQLNPQYGTSYEAGVYHSATIGGAFSADVTLSAYQMDLRDELDFDIQSFQYQNIGRSRHRGVESGVTLNGPAALRFFANYTLQSPESRSGDNAGNYLKAIPRHFISAGGGIGDGDGFALTTTFSSAMRLYLNDDNTRRLDDWSRVDLRASYGVAATRIFADVLNLLNSSYNSSGFPDPAGSDVVYYYPAAGRVLRVGIGREF